MVWMAQGLIGKIANFLVFISFARSLGQNFLTDDAILAKIAKTAAVQPGEIVLEVGGPPVCH